MCIRDRPGLRPDGDPAALASVAGAAPMPALQSMAVGVPPGLAKVVDRCLRKDKGERFSSARELLAALEPFEAARVVHALKVGETPYAGLSSFQEADAARFFGRAKETVAFVARLRTQPLMAVVGSSGAGKSSFVRAGVLPALKRAGERWRVGIQHPRPQVVGGAPLASLELKDGEAIGTSGDYHRYFEVAGRRYCHLLDPRTGVPAEGTQAVTILIAPGPAAGMRSDALSKPIFIAGRDWRTMARKLDVDAVLRVGADGTASATPAIRARLKIEVPDLKLEVVP